MGSEGWRRKKTRVSTPLATWADNNGLPERLAGLIADGEATPLVVELVKKFRAAHGATLSSAVKVKLMKELSSAGQWGAPTGKRAAPPESSSGSRAGGALRPRSSAAAAAGAAAREAVLRAEVAALKKAAAAVPRQARRKARRGDPAVAVPVRGPTKVVPEVVGDQADVDVEPTPPQWTCPACTTEWDFIPKKQCHLCKMQRAVTGPAAQAVASVEEDAVTVDKYKGFIAAINALGDLA